MTQSSILPQVIATGGAISLTIQASGATVLSRAISGVGGIGAYTQLYSGVPLAFYVDAGDALPGPLDPTQLYVYRMTDTNGTLVTAPVQPVVELDPEIEPLTALLIKLFQAAINSLTFPNGIKKAQVLQQMPIEGLPPMPFFTINQDLMQQTDIPIGQDVLVFDSNGQAIVTDQVNRMYKVSILSNNGNERDWYRDIIPGIFQIICAQVLAPAGLDVTHRFQIASGQVARDIIGKGPGFFFADASIEFQGTLNIAINSNIPLIQTLTFSALTSDGVVTESQVPAT